MPNNDLMNLTASLVDKLQNGEPRSGINWSSKVFIHDLPKRLEHSDALAATTHPLILSCPCVGLTHSLSQRRLRSYVSALQATRLALSRTEEACSVNTMCAIYFLWICQVRDTTTGRFVRVYHLQFHRVGSILSARSVSILKG